MRHTTFTGAYDFTLQLFADCGAGAEGGAPATADNGSLAVGQAVEQGSPAAEQTVTATPEQAVDLDAEFAELIKGKYKAQYQKTFKSSLDSRMKSANAKLGKLDTLAGIVADKYGIEDSHDVDKLISTVEALDRKDLEERAFKNGLTEEQQKYVDDLETKTRRYERERAEKEREDFVNRQVAEWTRQADDVTREFPDFDLGAELGNEAFVKLLDSGVDVKGAYVATHYGEIMQHAVGYTAQRVEENTVNKIRANGLRPSPNGTSAPQSATKEKTDVSKMTREQREEIYRRALAGEEWHP